MAAAFIAEHLRPISVPARTDGSPRFGAGDSNRS
jgi:hypothetical protein